MKKAVALICLMKGLTSFAAENEAVQETNYFANSSLSRLEYKDWNEKAQFTNLNAGVGARLAISKYFGASISAAVERNTFTSNQPDCNVNSWRAVAGVFAKSADIGSIGVHYSKYPNVYCSSSGNGVNQLDSYDMEGAYYLKDLTLNAVATVQRSDGASDQHSWNINAAYYVDENSKLGIGTGKSRQINLSYSLQPKIFDNKVRAVISYIHQAKIDNYVPYNGVSLTVSYYFGRNVDLLTRDRKY